MVIFGSPADVTQQHVKIWFGRARILQPLIAVGALSDQIGWSVLAAFRFVNDVGQREPDLAGQIVRVPVSRARSAHLAGIAIPLQDIGSGFL